jgi:outer membrane protein assembly factor BamB
MNGIPLRQVIHCLLLLLLMIQALFVRRVDAAAIGSVLDYSNSPLSFDPDGSAFTADSSGYVRLQMPARTITWKYTNSGAYTIEPILVGTNKIIYAANRSISWPNQDNYTTGTNALYAIDAETGRLKWWLDGVTHKLAMADGRLFAIFGNELMAIDPMTGATLWRTNTSISGGMAIGLNGFVVAAFGEGIAAFDAATGTLKWTHPGVDPVIGPDGRVFVKVNSYFIEAVDPEFGATEWRYFTGAALTSVSLLISPSGKVFFAANGIGAVDGFSGTELWHRQLSGVSHAVLASDGRLFAGQHLLDSIDGSILSSGSYPPNGPVSLSPTGLLFKDRDLRVSTQLAPPPLTGWPMPRGNPWGTASMNRDGIPIIVRQPMDVRFDEAGVQMWVGTTGSRPMKYQWYKGEALLANQTNAGLTISANEVTPGARYSVSVTNQFGGTVSRFALVGYEVKLKTYGSGRATVSPSGPIFEPGTTVTLQAIAANDRPFLRWTGGIDSAEPIVSMTLTGHLSSTAIFESRPGDILWKRRSGGSYPIIDDRGKAYLNFDSYNSWSVQIDVETGEVGQVFPGETVAVDARHVYMASSGILSAYDTLSGRRVWQIPNMTRFALSQGRIIRKYPQFQGLDPEDGSIVWTRELPNGSYGLSVSAAGRVSYCGGLASLFTVQASNGVVISELSLTPPLSARDAEAFPLSGGGWLIKQQGLCARLGNPRFATFPLDSPNIPIVGFNNLFYLGGRAIDSIDMSIKWTTREKSREVLLADNSLIVGGIAALDGNTGQEKWRSAQPLPYTLAVAVGSKPILISVGEGQITAIQSSAPLARTPWPCANGNADGSRASPLPAEPVIEVQPTSVAFQANQSVVLQSGVSGASPLSFQWLSNGEPIIGANSSSLTIQGEPTAPLTNIYTLVVSNSLGAASSGPVWVGYRVELSGYGGEIVEPRRAEVVRAGESIRIAAQSFNNRPFIGWSGPLQGESQELVIVPTNHLSSRAFFETQPGDQLWKAVNVFERDYAATGFGCCDARLLLNSRNEVVVGTPNGIVTLDEFGTIKNFFGAPFLPMLLGRDDEAYGIGREVDGWVSAAIDAEGRTIWRSSAEINIFTVLTANGFLANSRGAWDSRTGQEIWKNNEYLGRTLGFRNNIMLVERNDWWRGVEISTGRILWEKSSSDTEAGKQRWWFQLSALDESTAIAGAVGAFKLIDIWTGDTLAIRTNDAFQGFNRIGNANLYAVSHSVVAFDLASGLLQSSNRFTTRPGVWAAMSILAEDGTFYLRSNNEGSSGAITALTPSGQIAWRHELDRSISVNGLAPNSRGTVYALLDYSDIVAFAGTSPPARTPNAMDGLNSRFNGIPPLPHPRLRGAQTVSSNIWLEAETARFGRYSLESTSTLNDPRWIELTNFISFGTNAVFEFPRSTSNSFFRVMGFD